MSMSRAVGANVDSKANADDVRTWQVIVERTALCATRDARAHVSARSTNLLYQTLSISH